MTRGSFQIDDWKVDYSKSDTFYSVSFTHIGCLSRYCDHWIDINQQKKIYFIIGVTAGMSGFFGKSVPNPTAIWNY